MKTAITTQLVSSSRWKASLFFDSSETTNGTAYDIVSIGDIVSIRKEALDPQLYPEHPFNYIGLENVAPLTGDIVGFSISVGSDIRPRSKVFRKHDVLYGRLRANLNKVYLAEDEILEGICSGEFYVLVPELTSVVPLFLRSVLASDFVRAHVNRLQGGSSLPRLHIDDLLELSIPLPPLEEQKRIADFLRTQNQRRRLLAYEANVLPELTSAALVEALESGSPIDMVATLAPVPLMAAPNLPDAYESRTRRGQKVLSN